MSASHQRPSLFRKSLWQKRRHHYLAVFRRALDLLCLEKELPVSERQIVRRLRAKTVTARRELDPKGRFERPTFEAQNLPDPDFDEIKPHESKIPDIQWLHDDPDATSDINREKSFTIECKCLGHVRASGWNLNEQYVTGGVARFRSTDWRYGNHMSEGLMIGFIQDMEPIEVRCEVDGHLVANGFPQLTVLTNPSSAYLEFRHNFERAFAISPFQLEHLWVDIRAVPQTKPLGKTKVSKLTKNRPARKRAKKLSLSAADKR